MGSGESTPSMDPFAIACTVLFAASFSGTFVWLGTQVILMSEICSEICQRRV